MADKPICLWMRCDVAGDFSALESTLTSDQKARHQKLSPPARANEYLLGRWLCNQLSSHQCEDDSDGLPFLPAAPNLHLNITHSRNKLDLFIAAVVGKGPIGIDGEISAKKRHIEGLSTQWFSAPELTWLNAQGQDKAQRFFSLWTAKEALIKSQRGTLAEHLKKTHIGIDENGAMSDGELSVSHYHLADDIVLAIAHPKSTTPVRPIKTAVPIICYAALAGATTQDKNKKAPPVHG
jgi:phosphopantetheinyl transferase